MLMTTAVFLASFYGCASVQSVHHSFNQVTYDNMITKREAKMIAREVLVAEGLQGKYRLSCPRIIDNDHTFGYEHHWFISMKQRGIHFDPSEFIVVVHKRTGEVIYAEKKYPSNVLGYAGYSWIFDLHEAKMLGKI